MHLNLTNNKDNSERKKKTVMICDNEQDVHLFALVFKSQYNVILVNSGEECIKRYTEEIYRGNKIHLVILDYKLGSSMLGDSVARKINEFNKTNIILISAYDVDHSLVQELEEGKYISKYIKKPVTNDFLTDLVTEIVH